MSQKDFIAQAIKVKQRSVFDLSELYLLLYKWFELYGYDFQEQEYRDIEKAGKKNLEIRWYAEKKIDDYIKFVIKISFMVLGLESVEIEAEGVKRKSSKGEVEFRFDAFLLKDYEDYWEKGFIKFIREVYDKYIIKGRIDNLEGELQGELYKFIDEIKAFLNMHRM